MNKKRLLILLGIDSVPNKKTLVYILILFAIFVSILVLSPKNVVNWKDSLFWLAISFFISHLAVSLPRMGAISASFIGLLAVTFLFPPWASALIGFLSFPFNKGNLIRQLFNRSQQGIVAGVSAFIYSLSLWGIEIILTLISYFVLNTSAVLLLAYFMGYNPKELWRKNFQAFAPIYLLFSPISYLLAAMFRFPVLGEWGGWGVIMLLPLVFYIHYVWLYQKRLIEATESIIYSMARALDARDRYTYLHSERVAEIALDIGRKLKLSADELELIERGGKLHDIGKVGVPDSVLLKEGKLTDEEWRLMRAHPEIGAAILTPLPFFEKIKPIILYHHERWDGKGYPSGLAGEDIPVLARIVSVADAYEAMTSDRPYRRALDPEEALRRILEGAGTQFDPEIVKAFANLFSEEPVWKQKRMWISATRENQV